MKGKNYSIIYEKRLLYFDLGDSDYEKKNCDKR